LAGALGIILITAAILETYDIELFMREVKDYDIITNRLMLMLGAWGLIIAEIVLGTSTYLPTVIGLSSDVEDQIALFIDDLEPAFPVLKISEDDFYRLLGIGSIPRSIMVVKQHVLKTWDEEVPDITSIREALGK
jgi:hypothetical protein